MSGRQPVAGSGVREISRLKERIWATDADTQALWMAGMRFDELTAKQALLVAGA